MNSEAIAKILLTLGALLLFGGGVILLLGKLGIQIGHLPGDIRIERENFTCIFPLATSILLSLLLTLGLNLIGRLINK